MIKLEMMYYPKLMPRGVLGAVLCCLFFFFLPPAVTPSRAGARCARPQRTRAAGATEGGGEGGSAGEEVSRAWALEVRGRGVRWAWGGVGASAPSAAGRAKAGFLWRESFLRASTAVQGRKRAEQKAVGRVSREGASAARWRSEGVWRNRSLAAGVRTQAAAPRLVRQRC